MDKILETLFEIVQNLLRFFKNIKKKYWNSEQPDNNKRNVSESYSTEMNEVLERYRIGITW